MITNLLSVGLGGFLGAILRALTGIFISKFPTLLFFPFATLLVNVIGSFLIGIFLTLPLITSNPNLKSFLTAGLLGGLTTFSTFSFDTLTLIENQRFIAAGLNLFLNIVTALIFCYLGTLVSKLLMAN